MQEVQRIAKEISSLLGVPVEGENYFGERVIYVFTPNVFEDKSGYRAEVVKLYPSVARCDLRFGQYSLASLASWFEEEERIGEAFAYLRALPPSVKVTLTIADKEVREPDDLLGMTAARVAEGGIALTAKCRMEEACDTAPIVSAVVSALGFCLLLNGVYEQTCFKAESEGALVEIHAVGHERSRKNRLICLGYYGTRCMACGDDLREKYGDVAAGLIEVHHLKPVSKLKGAAEIDPIKDLVPLCPNCHAVVHRVDPPMSIEKLKERMRGK